MARKALTKIAKEAVKKGAKAKTKAKAKAAPKVKAAPPSPSVSRTPAAQRRADQRKTRAERSAKPKGPTPLTRTPAAQKRRSQRAARTATGTAATTAARTSSTTAARQASTTAGKIPTAVKAAAFAPAAGLTALAVTSKRKKPASEASKVTFGEAFKEARKKGEGTKFTWEGKQYTAVTKDDLKKKGYDANELRQYANRKGKARGPLNRLGQKAKKVLLGKDKKFGGDKGAIDFIRRPKKKAAGGMANSSAPKKFKAGGMANKGLGKAYMNSKR